MYVGVAASAGCTAEGAGVEMVVAPDRDCPKCMTGALKLKLGGICEG